jgi:hypothetical protein
MSNLATYVVTHQKIEWLVPFPHRLVTVGHYREEGAIASCDHIPPQMSDDRTAAWYRFIPGVRDDLARSPSDVFVSVVNHRFSQTGKYRLGCPPPYQKKLAVCWLRPNG